MSERLLAVDEDFGQNGAHTADFAGVERLDIRQTGNEFFQFVGNFSSDVIEGQRKAMVAIVAHDLGVDDEGLRSTRATEPDSKAVAQSKAVSALDAHTSWRKITSDQHDRTTACFGANRGFE